ncbi:MAG: APA family basic amino acid/polyamine antiporter [Rhodothermales bacterium]|jgi:APA family basic amino acid/polyamine antiporter
MAKTGSKLKKDLGLLDVYSIAMGTTLSSGFFLLPGLAYAAAGEAMVTSYMVAALLVVPAMFAMVELSTAMPKAGGAYYFLDRSMGPLVGTVGGLGTWLVLILKSAFALVGLGAYVGLFFPNMPILPLAIVMALVFGGLNLAGAKKTGSLQVVLVVGLITILTAFMGVGSLHLDAGQISALFDAEAKSIFATAGLVYMSYAGLTKVTSVAEEVRDPERNIALGMFLALGTAVVFYAVGTYVMISVIPPANLSGALTPVSAAADAMVGPWGGKVLAVAAILGFFAAANAGILSASRYPLAMGRDHLLPGWIRQVSREGTPRRAIAVTVGLVLVVLLTLDPTKIAKLAGAFQLLVFAFLCLAVIVMRESRIHSYDPGFRSPFYPWLHLFGIFSSLAVITLMGTLSILVSTGLVILCVAWYFYYAASRVNRGGAIFHWFARLGQRRYEGLDRELRGILKEKGLREADPFEEIVARASVIDAEEGATFEDVVTEASELLSDEVGQGWKRLKEAFLEGTRLGATPVTHGVALPHLKFAGLDRPALVLVRSVKGIHVVANDPLTDHVEEQDVHAMFFLISNENDPGQHLRILAQIAGRVDDEGFSQEWLGAGDEQDIREVVLRDDRFVTIPVRTTSGSRDLIGKELKDVHLHKGALVALIQREGDVHVPDGSSVIREGDRLTVLGEPAALLEIRKRYLRVAE